MSAPTPGPATVPAVDPAEGRALVEAGAVLLDVREDAEWEAGHAPQAVHLPLGRVAQAVDQLDRSQRYVAVCRSGRRSAAAVALLRDAGVDAVNLDGGMQAWHAAGAPLVSGSGATPAVV